MEAVTRSRLLLELLWWVITAIAVVAVMYPIVSYTNYHPAPWQNVAYIVAAITFTRYLFLLPTTLIAQKQAFKVMLMFVCMPLVPVFWVWLAEFQGYIDDRNIEDLLPDVLPDDHEFMLKYLRNEMMFFCTLAIISAFILPIRLIISLFRTHNYGTV